MLDPALCAPGENMFTTTIDNTYFPLPDGQQWVYQGKEGGETIGLRITVLDATETFYNGRRSVTTRVVEELEWVDENANGIVDPDETLIEVSNNFLRADTGRHCLLLRRDRRHLRGWRRRQPRGLVASR
jgi:hypothetical protein